MENATTTINLQVDSEIKEQAGMILDAMGLSFNDAFNFLLNHIKMQRRLPLDMVAYNYTPKQETLDFIERIENGEEDIIGSFSSKEELWQSLGI
ncbi:MAG: type II toxin-antitoxin system RelB/DinJ family antitoxin [Defluviitaleaceae bacterium]|nr:type II toxin-antitoxin system RelB/DinJ family antitoxin [Defluviitaleaceae bacterium]